ncbi:MAG TPA: hypothetical protein VF223_01275 [Trebonia sp.]
MDPHPGSKLSTLAWRQATTLGPGLGIADAATDKAVQGGLRWRDRRPGSL